MGFAGTEVVHLAASLAIRRDVPLTERSKAALPVRRQGANKGCYFYPRKGDHDISPIAGVSKRWLKAKRLADIPERVVL